MREFYKKCLDRTYEIFGVRQTDEEKMSEDDVKFLLDGLCRVSKSYDYIPESDQKRIISACMLSDKTYRNINLRLVAGWLSDNGKKFFTEIAHKQNEQKEDYKVLEGEERDRAINNYLNVLAQTTCALSDNTVKGSGSRLRENLNQHGIIRPPHQSLETIEELKDKNAVRSFWIGGFEIYAKDEDRAMEIYKQNFGEPKDKTVYHEQQPDKEATEGTDSLTEDSKDSPDPTSVNNDL